MEGVASVVGVKNPRPEYVELTLAAPWIAEAAVPGQYVHLHLSSEHGPPVRKPVSLFATDGEREALILFHVEGEESRKLAGCKEGDQLDLMGPRGRGFRIDEPRENEAILLAAGGIGIAPIHFLSLVLRDRDMDHEVFLGARGEDHLLGVDLLESMGQEVSVSTEDGSVGRKGLVIEALEQRLWELSDRPVRLYACGPAAMLEAIIGLCHWYRNVSPQISLERWLGCGLGACMGCVVRTVRGYERACIEGPVFDARDITVGALIEP